MPASGSRMKWEEIRSKLYHNFGEPLCSSFQIIHVIFVRHRRGQSMIALNKMSVWEVRMNNGLPETCTFDVPWGLKFDSGHSKASTMFRLLLKAGCRWDEICTKWVENLVFEVILVAFSSVSRPET